MATPVFCCGFEEGIAGVHWTVSSATFVTASPISGTYSLRCNPSASIQHATSIISLAGGVHVVRFRVNFSTLPNAQVFLGGSTDGGAWFNNADSKIYAKVIGGSLVASGVSVTTGVTYFIDVNIDTTANPWIVDVQVSGSACGQASRALTGTTSAKAIRVGCTETNSTADLLIDDVLYSTTSGDYPLGNGYVNHFVPTADGTHNIAGTGDFQRTTTGTDILNASTTAFQLVDEVPLEATVTDWINMVAPPNATDYVECIFGPAPGISTPTTGPRAVEVVCGINQAGTGAGNM